VSSARGDQGKARRGAQRGGSSAGRYPFAGIMGETLPPSWGLAPAFAVLAAPRQGGHHGGSTARPGLRPAGAFLRVGCERIWPSHTRLRPGGQRPNRGGSREGCKGPGRPDAKDESDEGRTGRRKKQAKEAADEVRTGRRKKQAKEEASEGRKQAKEEASEGRSRQRRKAIWTDRRPYLLPGILFPFFFVDFPGRCSPPGAARGGELPPVSPRPPGASPTLRKVARAARVGHQMRLLVLFDGSAAAGQTPALEFGPGARDQSL